MKRILWLPVLVCIGLGCGTARAPVSPDGRESPAALCAPAPPAHVEEDAAPAIDDRRQMQRLLTESVRLKDAGQTVKMATLIEQLKSTRCKLALAPAPKEVLTGEALYERAKPSVLVVGSPYKCEKCGKTHVGTATAFVISAGGACVTNYHVVDEPKKDTLTVMTADGRVLAVKAVLAASKADDVAIFQVDGLNARPLPLAAGAPVGSRVRVISHPEMRFYTLTEGVVSRYSTFRRAGAEVPSMSITADYARGSSGGPVLSDAGAVVGLVSTTHSIYYEEQDGKQTNLQMVVKQCVPAASVLKLVQP
jgi:S1-C subfamily serine protease